MKQEPSLNEFTLYEVDEWETILDEESPAAADHLVALGDGSWGLWRWVCLRGAGFPVHDVLQLAAPRAAAAANQLLEAEADHVRCQTGLLDALAIANRDCRQALAEDSLDADAQEDLRQTIRTLRRAEKRLLKGQLPDEAELPDSFPPLLQAAHTAFTRIKTCQEYFAQALAFDKEQVAAAIRHLASDNRFREAVTWQNRHALHTGIDPLLQTLPSSSADKKTRQREELIASYVQRYCVKNDSIGFFGPIGWARLNPQQGITSVQPGKTLVETRTVYFEHWGIAALGQKLSQDETLRTWCVPYRMPFSYLDGTTLHLPAGQTVTLSVRQATVLRACDGQKNARQIARQLVGDPLLNFRVASEVYDTLHALAEARRIVWQLEIPTEGAYPEQYLRQWALTIEDEFYREQVLSPLRELEQVRGRVAAAAGDPHRLDQVIRDLETTFTHLTGVEPTRRAGKTYAARTLVYEDCRRDVQVNLGTDLLHSLEAPLTLLLTSARWFTYHAAQHYRRALRQVFAEVYAHYPEPNKTPPTVGMADFWLWCHPLLFGDNAQPIDDLVTDFQQRWTNILRDATGNYRPYYHSRDLILQVQNNFAAPGPGWPSACYHSPDVMIAAASLDALQQGEYQFVLGEVHVGVNTLTASCFLHQHPAPETLFQAVQSDLANPCIIPMNSQEWKGKVARTQMVVMSPDDIRLLVSPNTGTLPGVPSISIGELLVEDAGNTLLVRSRDGQQCYDIIEVLALFIVQAGLSGFKIIPAAKHTPRITFDRLVVSRETWCFTPEDMPFAEEEDEMIRFLDARRWAAQNGLPRFVFVKAPVEPKPFYVDFDSPLYLQLLAKVIRQTGQQIGSTTSLTFTEMLPAHEQTWLTDDRGRKYTSELRFVAVDKSGAAAASMFLDAYGD